MVRRLDAVDAAAGKVDQTGGFVEFFSPRPQRPTVPRPMPPRTGDLWCSARENHHRGTTVGEVMGEGNARKPLPPAITNFLCSRELIKKWPPGHRTGSTAVGSKCPVIVVFRSEAVKKSK